MNIPSFKLLEQAPKLAESALKHGWMKPPLSARLREVRKRKGLSVQELSVILGSKKHKIEAWERGDLPDADTLSRIDPQLALLEKS